MLGAFWKQRKNPWLLRSCDTNTQVKQKNTCLVVFKTENVNRGTLKARKPQGKEGSLNLLFWQDFMFYKPLSLFWVILTYGFEWISLAVQNRGLTQHVFEHWGRTWAVTCSGERSSFWFHFKPLYSAGQDLALAVGSTTAKTCYCAEHLIKCKTVNS